MIDVSINLPGSFDAFEVIRYSPSAGADVSDSEIAAVERYLWVGKISVSFNPKVVLQIDA